MEQLIYVCDALEIANDRNSKVPNWPVQDNSGRWNYEKFNGQRVAYSRANIYFGFMARKMDYDEVVNLNIDDLPQNVYITACGNFYSID
jgi:hypothetical protein